LLSLAALDAVWLVRLMLTLASTAGAKFLTIAGLRELL
jgi:hypothetical protein